MHQPHPLVAATMVLQEISGNQASTPRPATRGAKGRGAAAREAAAAVGDAVKQVRSSVWCAASDQGGRRGGRGGMSAARGGRGVGGYPKCATWLLGRG